MFHGNVLWGGGGVGEGGEIVHSRDSTMHLQSAASVWCPICCIQWHVRKQRVVRAVASMYNDLKVWHPRCVKSIIQGCSVCISLYIHTVIKHNIYN